MSTTDRYKNFKKREAEIKAKKEAKEAAEAKARKEGLNPRARQANKRPKTEEAPKKTTPRKRVVSKPKPETEKKVTAKRKRPVNRKTPETPKTTKKVDRRGRPVVDKKPTIKASEKPKPKPKVAATPKPTKSGKFGAGDSKTIMHKGKEMANVSAEQLKASGLTLREYMNKWNKTGKRP